MIQLKNIHPWVMVRLEDGDIAPFTGVHWYGDIDYWVNGEWMGYYTNSGLCINKDTDNRDSFYNRSSCHSGSPVTLIAHSNTIDNPEYAPHNEWGEVSP